MSDDQNEFGPGSTPALMFHRMAQEFLAGYGFALVNNPNTVYSPYQASRATYKNANGFYLDFCFDPFDGRSCGISGGRYWCSKGAFLGELNRFLGLSGDYSELAKITGCEIARFHLMKLGDEMEESMRALLQDLDISLSSVLDKITLRDLVGLEKKEQGLESRTKQHFGDNFEDDIEISDFIE